MVIKHGRNHHRFTIMIRFSKYLLAFYAAVLVVVHHLVLYFLEAFTLAHFAYTLWHACLASAVTLVIVLGLQLLKRH